MTVFMAFLTHVFPPQERAIQDLAGHNAPMPVGVRERIFSIASACV